MPSPVKIKFSSLFRLRLIALVMLGLYAAVVNARQPSPKRPSVTISIVNNSTLRVQIELSSPGNRWSFRNAFAGALGLGERMEQFQASRSNEPVRVKRLASGE